MTDRADQLLAEGFARHAVRWASAEGAGAGVAAAVGHAATALSLAVSEGHVCLMLASLAIAPTIADGDAPAVQIGRAHV